MPQGSGRGDRDSGTYQQLTLDLFPTEKEQIEKIDKDAESERPSAFSISDEEIENVLRSGSGFAGGKRRITVLYEKEGNANLTFVQCNQKTVNPLLYFSSDLFFV